MRQGGSYSFLGISNLNGFLFVCLARKMQFLANGDFFFPFV